MTVKARLNLKLREGIASVLPIALIVMLLCFTITPVSTDLVLTFMAKGTATSEHLDLYGLEPTEKAVVAAVADSEKSGIMRAILEQTGPHTPAGVISFSLPISTVAGLRNVDKD